MARSPPKHLIHNNSNRLMILEWNRLQIKALFLFLESVYKGFYSDFSSPVDAAPFYRLGSS